MALKRELIQFNIVNQTDCVFNLSLFQQNVYSVNATTKYSYDVTTIDLSCGTGTIVVNGNALNLTFSPNLTSFLAALNGLGFGFFCSETIGGNTFVYTVDDTNVYGDMDVCPVVCTTTTTTTTTVPETTTTTTTTTVPETTTTTTTTTVPETTTTTTTTTLACDNVEFIEIFVTVGGTVNYIDCYQTPRVQTVGAGTEFIGVGTGVLVSSLTGDAVYTITNYGSCCLAETTTTTTTTTVPETTTTTTTTTVPETTTTTTTTTLACDNVEFIEIFVTVGGTVNYIDCYQTPRVQTVGAGTEFIGVGTGVLVSSLTGDAVYTITNYGSCCLAETTTTTTTTTIVVPTGAYSTANASDACTAGIPMTNVVFGGGTGLCDSTTIQTDQFVLEIAGATVWVSIGGEVREATINDPNVSGIATFVGSCSICGATTTTTTTTLLETTTTTTTTTSLLVCTEFYNNTGSPITGLSYTDCNGTVVTNGTVDAGQSICVQGDNSPSGFLILLGDCTPSTP